MKTGSASPYHGRLDIRNLPNEVRLIWYSRNKDLPEMPTTGTLDVFQQTDDDLEDKVDLIRRLILITPLTKQEDLAITMNVLEDYTLEDVGRILGVTRERVRQILSKGLRKFRRYHFMLTDDSLKAMNFKPIPIPRINTKKDDH